MMTKKSPFENPLRKDKSVFIHHKNLRSFTNEMYKVHRVFQQKF